MPGLDVTVERNVEARMRDGVVLRADVYRPTDTASSPVLLMRSIYNKAAATPFGHAHPAWFAAKGYMVVIQDTRGRYASDGDFYPFQSEMNDGYDTVQWASQLAGSSGGVGMMGLSYLGATQLLAAVTRPPSLKSIAPAFTASQYYDGWTYNGGAFAMAFASFWANLLAMETAARTDDRDAYAELAGSLRDAPSWFSNLPAPGTGALTRQRAPYYFDWIEHSTYDEYWKRWSIDEDYSRVDVSAIHLGGWYDIFLTGTVKNFLGIQALGGSEATRRRQKLLIGPWTHGPWSPVGRMGAEGPATRDVDDWLLRWFDHTLKGVENGVLDSPVTIFSVDGTWQDLDGWPPSNTRNEEWFLHSAGRAQSKFGDGVLDRNPPGDEPPDIFVYSPASPIPSLGGHSCCADAITPMGPADQHAAEVSPMVLVYTSDALSADMDLMGNVTLKLHMATTVRDTDFTARLCVVDESGKSVNLQEGIVRARYRDSLSSPALLEPGKIYELLIDLGPIGAHIPANSSLRIDISSSDFPQWDRNLNTGGAPLLEPEMAGLVATQSVFHSRTYPTSVSLPVMR